jgi:hypothetical protein
VTFSKACSNASPVAKRQSIALTWSATAVSAARQKWHFPTLSTVMMAPALQLAGAV